MTNDTKLENVIVEPKKPKRNKIASLDRRKAKAGWLFVLPFVVGFVLVYIPVIFDSLRYSFSKIIIDAAGSYSLEFVGWTNYSDALLVDPNFVQTLISGLKTLAFNIPAIIIFSLFMAVLLNQKMWGRAVFRVIFFVPVILSTGLIESINAQNILDDYFSSEGGIDTGAGTNAGSAIASAINLERLFENMKVGTELVEIVTSMITNISEIVNKSGVQMLIFLAGLQSISPAIYESCQIDGATGWETFWKITFPMISPMILVNAVYTIIDSFTTDSNAVMGYIQQIYQESTVRSSAMSWIYFLIVILVVGAVAGLFSAYVFYQKRD